MFLTRKLNCKQLCTPVYAGFSVSYTMRLTIVTGCLLLHATLANAQKCNTDLDSVFDARDKSVNGPSIVYQNRKTQGTTTAGKTVHLWLRRDFASGPSIGMSDQYGTVSVKTKNYTFLYGELMHDSTLRDMGVGEDYHGRVSFIFTDGDSITLQTYPIPADKFYPERQNISFVILLNNQWPFPNDEMRKTFGIKKLRAPGATELRDKLKEQPLRQLRYAQSYILRNTQGVAELHYADPVTVSFTPEESAGLMHATDCLTRKVVDKRFP